MTLNELLQVVDKDTRIQVRVYQHKATQEREEKGYDIKRIITGSR
nr:MAG TPA: hypothetical protein [Caudoviricetes sp.]